MALKRGSHSVRFTNVANVGVEKDASSSSSSDVEPRDANKVRKIFSTKRLMKEKGCFDVDTDHIYSAVSSCELLKKRKIRKTAETGHKAVKTRCFSKNAIMARLSRERKKAYISTLENENESLREQHNEIKKKVDIQNKTITTMKREILYLKGLLANSKELGQILRNLQNTTSLPVTSSLISNTKDNSLIKSQEGFQEKKSNIMPNPLVKFPMIYEDINLGSTFDKTLNCDDSAYFEHSLVKDESDTFPFEFNENFICTLGDPPNRGDNSFYSNANDPDFGICLHVNQKRISVEVCSVCSNNANLCNLCSHEHDISTKIGST